MKQRLLTIYQDGRIFSFLAIMVLFGLVTGLYTGIFNNYLHEVLNLTKAERGYLEFPRELPGLLLFLMLAVLYRFSEFRLMRVALVIAVIGIAGLLFVGPVRWAAVLFITLWSTGEHLMMPVRSSIGLHLATPGKEGVARGILQGFSNAGQTVGFYLAPLVIILFSVFSTSTGSLLKFRWVYILAVVLLLAGLVATARLRKNDTSVERKRISFQRKYSKYYVLEIFFGARKQVFLTFAPYVLIVQYQAPAELISLLYGIWSLANIFVAPLVGKLIDRLGYKKVLIIDAFVLILLCLIYGFAHRLFDVQVAFIVTCVVFVLDAMLFAFGMARDLYAKTKAESTEELTTTLSTGISVNHLVSIFIAVGGGALWQQMGTEALFSVAALLGVGSCVFSFSLKDPTPQKV